MRFRFLACFLILFIALTLQFLLARVGIYFDLTFAALISLAFVLDFWMLLLLIVIAVFILNWEPAASVEIVFIALFPVIVHFSRNILHWQRWLENAIAVLCGFLILYAIAAGAALLANPKPFLVDLAAAELFVAIFFFPHYRWESD